MNDMIKLIQHTRLKKGYNFFDIEQATGIPAKKMHSFEKGLTQLSLDELDKLFIFLGIQQAKDMKVSKPKKANRSKKRLVYTGMATLILVVILLIVILPLEQKNDPSPSYANDTPTLANGPEVISSSDAEALEEPADTEKQQESTSPSVVEQPNSEGLQLRFWGTMPYHTEYAPTLDNEYTPADYEIYTIEGLIKRDAIPEWLATKDRDRTLLNLATRYVWSEMSDDEFVVVKERDRLNKLGYKNIGLDYSDTVTEPFIMETAEGKIGILPFSRHVLHAEHLAERNEIGLARASNLNVVRTIVEEAKKEVDVLIVLVGWGERNDFAIEKRQRDAAEVIAAAGADIIIGNHSVYAQEIAQIESVPIFYSLGHAIPTTNVADAYSLALDVTIIDQKLTQMTVHTGKSVDGKVTYNLSEQEKQAIKSSLLTPELQRLVDLP